MYACECHNLSFLVEPVFNVSVEVFICDVVVKTEDSDFIGVLVSHDIIGSKRFFVICTFKNDFKVFGAC